MMPTAGALNAIQYVGSMQATKIATSALDTKDFTENLLATFLSESGNKVTPFTTRKTIQENQDAKGAEKQIRLQYGISSDG